MGLPNAHLAVVDREKLVEYLLNPAHPDNGGKAAFFMSKGFRIDQWDVLAAALRRLAADTMNCNAVQTVHGSKYIVDGAMDTPAGQRATVRCVWIVDAGSDIPRLVTAYPQG